MHPPESNVHDHEDANDNEEKDGETDDGENEDDGENDGDVAVARGEEEVEDWITT